MRHKVTGSPQILALTHDMVFENRALKSWVPKLGAIPAKKELALEAFRKGYSVLVYPGGDRDAFRPYSKRAEVDFDGRTGYAALALEADVPIVPVAYSFTRKSVIRPGRLFSVQISDLYLGSGWTISFHFRQSQLHRLLGREWADGRPVGFRSSEGWCPSR